MTIDAERKIYFYISVTDTIIAHSIIMITGSCIFLSRYFHVHDVDKKILSFIFHCTMVSTDKDLVPLNRQKVSLCVLCPSRRETNNLWGAGTSKPLFPNLPMTAEQSQAVVKAVERMPCTFQVAH